MNDERLQALYRKLATTRADVGADDIVEVLARSGHPDVEGTPADRVATSTAHADILRVALALQADADALARDAAAQRAAIARRVPPARRWLALAAGVGSAAVLIAGLRGVAVPPDTVVVQPLPPTAEVILSGSFESAPRDRQQVQEAEPIFRGSFDS